MYADTSPFDPAAEPSTAGMQGRAVLRFGGGEDRRTRLKDLFQSSPFRVLFPTEAANELSTAVLVTTSGGLVGGDHLDVVVNIDAGARAQVLGQAAEKVYRSLGADSRVTATLNVAEDGYLEWLPQETIVFDQARLRRTTTVDVASGGVFSGAEILLFGRAAMGEKLQSGLVRDVWEVRRDGQRVWADALHLDGDVGAKLRHPAGFGGAVAAATFVHVSADGAARLTLARALLEDQDDQGDEACFGLRCGATLTNGVLVVRWLADDGQILRAAFARFWGGFRAQTQNLPGTMPRLWHI